MKEINITKNNFENEVLNSDRTVLVDFWASWCGPCQMLSPVISQIAEEHPEIKVCKVNVDDEIELAGAFRISSIPMIAVIKNGKITGTSTGYMPKHQIESLLQ